MTPNEVKATLVRTLVATLGEDRVQALAPEIQVTAEALSLVLSETVEFEDGDPDFMRPLA